MRILLPVDLSPRSAYAYDLARRITAGSGGEIHLLAIVPAPPDAVFDTRGQLKEDGGEDYSALKAELSRLQAALEEWRVQKPEITQITAKIGRVEEDILAYIQAYAVDLVVIGAAGAGGLDEWLRGSHTQHLVRNAPAPVLSLKCDRSQYLIEDIALACDFRDARPHNLDVVRRVRDAFGARLHLLKVNTPSDFESTREVQNHMRDFAERNGLGEVVFQLYSDRTVEEGIAHFSADTGIDFVAIGAHQRQGISRIFRPSLVEHMVNHLWQPILAFPLK
jgi:nucleotide-binding universal stress UspA family protein